MMKEEGKRRLNRDIQRFYDVSTPLWESVWGDHMHHGFYGSDGTVRKHPYEAQVDMIEALRTWGGLTSAGKVLDAGCGIGGSSRHLAERLGAEVVGITLSPVQAERARVRARLADLDGRLHFEVADAMAPPFPHGSFDAVWALESAEHFPDKKRWLETCVAMLRSGGRIVLATWCRRPLPPPLTRAERRLLERLYAAYHLPDMMAITELAALAGLAGFEQIETADWTAAVVPFWKDVIRSAMQPASVVGLLKAGWPTIRGALAIRHMIQGYRSGLIRYGVLRGIAP